MDIQRELYEFAASAGALEGFVYMKDEVDPAHIENWIKNLVKQYGNLPEGTKTLIQPGLNRTIGRAVHSIIPAIGETHPLSQALRSIIQGDIPDSASDFSREKEEKANL